MRDLRDLPRNSAVRKINELVKRVRICKVHAYIISHLKVFIFGRFCSVLLLFICYLYLLSLIFSNHTYTYVYVKFMLIL
jgi:hypothetical protein